MEILTYNNIRKYFNQREMMLQKIEIAEKVSILKISK